MKTLADGTEVSARTFYYLLDWNDRDSWKFIQENFGKRRLMDLTIDEYIKLWIEATKYDLENLKKKI
jgi:hypothetical protein